LPEEEQQDSAWLDIEFIDDCLVLMKSRFVMAYIGRTTKGKLRRDATTSVMIGARIDRYIEDQMIIELGKTESK